MLSAPIDGHRIELFDDVGLATRPAESDATRVVLSRAGVELVEFLVAADGSDGARLEQFRARVADPLLPKYVAAAIEDILPQVRRSYVIGLYPVDWHPALEPLGFHRLSERVMMRISSLSDGYVSSPPPADGVAIHPLSASAQRLADVLGRSEGESVPRSQCFELCRSILAGEFGPVIGAASHEVAVDGELAGACIFTEYRGTPLVGHVFVDKARQKCGLAVALMRRCLSGLAAVGYDQALASIDVTNEASKRLHSRVGFVAVEPRLTCGYLVLPAGEA